MLTKDAIGPHVAEVFGSWDRHYRLAIFQSEPGFKEKRDVVVVLRKDQESRTSLRLREWKWEVGREVSSVPWFHNQPQAKRILLSLKPQKRRCRNAYLVYWKLKEMEK